MNKQIKNLMDHTLDEKFAGTWSTMDMQDLTKFSERFAELILKECAAYIDDNIGYDDCNNTYPVSGGELKYHFGVEE